MQLSTLERYSANFISIEIWMDNVNSISFNQADGWRYGFTESMIEMYRLENDKIISKFFPLANVRCIDIAKPVEGA